MVFEILCGVMLAGGCFFMVVAGVGMLRLPDVYSRIHAAGMGDSFGAPMLLTGLLVYAIGTVVGLPEDATAVTVRNAIWVCVKLVLVLFFVVFTSPISGHALAKAAFLRGLEPYRSKRSVRTASDGGQE